VSGAAAGETNAVSINDHYRTPERDALPPLMERARLAPDARPRVAATARDLIAAMRAAAQQGGGIEQFLQEYRITSAEGVVLLCLAEAFLRIPDAATADALIKDKLGDADWRSHVGKSPSFLVNISSFMLVATGRLVSLDEADNLLSRLVARVGEPVLRQAVRAAMHFMGDQFILGKTIEGALERSRRFEAAGFRHSFDMLGEGARTMEDARRYLAAYEHAIAAIGKYAAGKDVVAAPGISVKLSALHPRYEAAQRDRALAELAPSVIALGEKARGAGIGMTIDAEESERLELSLELLVHIAMAPSLAGWDGLGLAVQAYQKRALDVIGFVDELGARAKRRIMVRLVKGAYWDTEIKRAQERGMTDYPVFTRKASTDVSYLACARAMLSAGSIYPAFATHNALTVATLVEWAGQSGNKNGRDFEFQRLHGMGDGLYEALHARDSGYHCRTYAPVGGHDDLLAYLVRRLLENGANSSFVNRIQDRDTTLEDLIADPVEATEAVKAAPHPRIPMPVDLYGPARKNSLGIDLSDRETIARLEAEFAAQPRARWSAAPIVGGRLGGDGAAQTMADPSDLTHIIGEVRGATAGEVDRAVALAAKAQPDWNAAGAAHRAACLRRAADLLEARRLQFMGIAIREAGKTIPDALAEIREAADFLRYYAMQAERDFAPVALDGPTGESNQLALAGRGVFACVSPWNFPLAIFTGQIAAALAAGNAVVAKPAPQTPIMGCTMVQLLHEAGVSADALALVTGAGETGARLVGHAAIAGVAFTGSTATARGIARALAAGNGPIVPLIAETGGQNAMIIDSSALPEQVVADLLISAFQSAGQRCSAARLMYAQEDVADKMIEMLSGAMDELRIGDPGQIATDIGPVIDEAAARRLEAHLANMGKRVVHRLAAPKGGWFVGPALVAIDSPSDLPGEVFGPILHVLRWRAGHLDQVVDAINATGFGLTLGLHSRIGDTVDFVRARARVGNLYVNRSMIGAVVGAQPFGGEGLSGTGPKAGGPNYVRRFATERVTSIDTTSAGGNASLMAMEE
jgi:RHH-type proline utilization regulon transcriptional repressor/proline dehydrogenase/delta 1-pyrroline-5-carboxylate dehydrogenase